MPADSASHSPVEARATERRPWLPRWLSSEHPFPWLFPAAALMVVFGIYPLVYAITLSLYKRNAATRKMIFDPTHNWTKVLADERVWNAIYNTFLYTGVALFFQLTLGMLIALLLDSDRKGYGVLRAMMTLPLVIPPAVTGMMFLLMLNGSFGVLSRGLIALGIFPTGFSILGTANTAMAGVLTAEIWQWTPFMVLIMLAGLRSLPKEPFEAAAIDGATATQAFFKLTLPMMSKVIAIAVLIRGIDLFRAFD
jgi:multiple sugar transport system permease protein